mgnify:FL=1
MEQFIWAYQVSFGFIMGMAFGLAVLMYVGINIWPVIDDILSFLTEKDDAKERK